MNLLGFQLLLSALHYDVTNFPVLPLQLDHQVIYDNKTLAGWISELTWKGPFPPSKRSTCGDPYYRIDGGVPLDEWLIAQRICN